MAMIRNAGGLFVALVCFANSAFARDDALFAAARAEQQPTIETLRALTAFDSGTLNGSGVVRVADLAEARLKALGFATERVSATPSAGVNLVGRLDGRGTKRFLLLAHMDTVYLDGTAAKQPFRVEGDRAYGVGISDDKAGIATVLHALKLLRDARFEDFRRITVLFNADEERGSVGSEALIRQLAADADATLSFEGTGIERENIRTGTSGITRVTVKIVGRASHAGAAPERGVNALVEAADLVLRTQDIDDRARGLRFNWTVERAGAVSNVIPDAASVEADVRYVRESDLDDALAKLRERVARQRLPDAKLDIEVRRGRPPMQPTDGARHIVGLAQDIYHDLGLVLEESGGGGGGTDAAYAAQTCKAVVESMGLPGFGAHANTEEFVRIDRIPARLYLAAELLRRIATSKDQP
jgi:glutamate carboxypeptidase